MAFKNIFPNRLTWKAMECVRLLEKGSLNTNFKTIAPNCPNGSGKKIVIHF